MPSLRSGITSGLGLCIRPYRYASQLVRRYYKLVQLVFMYCPKLSPVVVILGSRQSLLYDQDLNFQFNFESKFGKPILEKDDSSPNLKELHPEHISALHHAGLSSGSLG